MTRQAFSIRYSRNLATGYAEPLERFDNLHRREGVDAGQRRFHASPVETHGGCAGMRKQDEKFTEKGAPRRSGAAHLAAPPILTRSR
jgi:hypothetical protein